MRGSCHGPLNERSEDLVEGCSDLIARDSRPTTGPSAAGAWELISALDGGSLS